MKVLGWLRARWYARLRRIDLDILWPACRDRAPSLDQARAAFAFHALQDPAWRCLGEPESLRIIDGLA